MSKIKRYNLNPETLLYEVVKVPRKERLSKIAVLMVVSLGFTALYFWIYVGLLGFDPPKTAILKRNNAKWASKLEVMNRNLDQYSAELKDLELRNDDVYRSIFGMNPIPEEVLNAGFGGVKRYAYLDEIGNNSVLRNTYIRLDMLTKQTYVQSKSFDEVSNLSKRAGDMASCIPAIPPILPAKGTFRVSSPFGTRRDPVHGGYRHHDGFDIATKKGNPVYATGDGVIEKTAFQFFGYGNQIVIDHGFGYKTRYAHLSSINVVEGMKIKRGEKIGEVGNSGKSTGPHLHYEVIYRGSAVNPMNFFDLTMSDKEYKDMIKKKEGESQAVLHNDFHLMVK